MIDVEQVLKKHKLLDLLIGKGEYYIKPLDEFSEPTDYDRLWRNYIIFYLGSITENKKHVFEEQFRQTLLELCEYDQDYSLACYTILSNLRRYFYYKKEKPSINLDIDWNILIKFLRNIVLDNWEQLKQDKRWAGVDWNTIGNVESGILGVLYDASEKIATRFNGPRFL